MTFFLYLLLFDFSSYLTNSSCPFLPHYAPVLCSVFVFPYCSIPLPHPVLPCLVRTLRTFSGVFHHPHTHISVYLDSSLFKSSHTWVFRYLCTHIPRYACICVVKYMGMQVPKQPNMQYYLSTHIFGAICILHCKLTHF